MIQITIHDNEEVEVRTTKGFEETKVARVLCKLKL